jgi:hypothetical protein
MARSRKDAVLSSVQLPHTASLVGVQALIVYLPDSYEHTWQAVHVVDELFGENVDPATHGVHVV